jgi:6-phosphogluconolactonase
VLGEPVLAAESVNPSFLALHPSGRFLYAINEVDSFEGRTGAASAFAVGPDGKLSLLNQSSTRGPGPCYISLDRAGKHALVANYGGGSVAVLPVAADGKLGTATAFVQHETLAGADAQRPKRPHGHSIDLEPAGRFALVADLGLDRIYVYRLGADGALTPADPPFTATDAGAGPRHIAIHPSGRHAYVLQEKHMTVDTYALDAARGVLTHKQKVSSLPEGVAVAPGFSGAEILLHPTGRFLYASNRGHDTIAVFAVDEAQGTVKPVEHVAMGGKIPRGFGIDPTGRWLIAGNQRSDSVSVFRIDPPTGKLTSRGQTVALGAPVSVVFAAPAGAAR